jgi:predicted RNA-binding protein with PUA-like domain
MQPGDLVFFYHSGIDTPAIVGIAEVVSEAYPDHTAFDPKDEHFDPGSDPQNPRWVMVDIRYKRKLKRPLSLAGIKSHADRLDGLALIQRGNRLSVMPVDEAHWNFILSLESA